MNRAGREAGSLGQSQVSDQAGGRENAWVEKKCEKTQAIHDRPKRDEGWRENIVRIQM